ncbi:Clavaminate synthase-like protein [Pilatotrama ljubarskyi]|nr:Clavaminate synthase-like protein [Pilatotrama ljubarskyi]
MPAGIREAFQSFVAEMQDKHCPNTEELFACDPSSARTLVQAAQSLSEDHPPPSRSSTRTSLSELRRHAHTAMAASTAGQARGWRRIYTDSCVLLAYTDVLDHCDSRDNDRALSAVAHLDHAIVIAGAAGDGRLDLVLDLIEGIQSECLSTPSALRRDLSFVSPQEQTLKDLLRRLPTASQPVPRLDIPPSLASFISRLSRQPFVLPGFLRDWPALNEHPWRSLDYLRAVAGPGRVVPIEVGSDYRADNWSQNMMLWEEFLESLAAASSTPTEPRPVLYLAQHSLFKQFPALQGDVIIPDYVYSSLDPPENYPQYAPPGNEEQLVLNAWLGPGGTISPAHTDPFYNFYAQVVGHKTVWLAPPEVSSYMYPYPSTSLQASDASSKGGNAPRNPAANQESPSMSNTTQVDVFLSTTDDLDKSKARFPDFWEKVVPTAISVTLEPGDLLFFPPGWWHAMRSEDLSFSVSMWF